MRSVFISHSRFDLDKANWLTHVLRNEGVEVFRADRFGAESDWQAEILSAIKRCSAFVAFIDEATPNVMLELGYALGTAKPVLLVVTRETQIPFDIASLPIAHLDESDIGSVLAIAERLRNNATLDRPSNRQFEGVRDQLARLSNDPEYLDEVSPEELENCVVSFLKDIGFEVIRIGGQGELGYDILITDALSSFQAAIQLKKYSRNRVLGVSSVRQLVGALMLSEIPVAILLSTTVFSASAQSLAQKSPRPILLMTVGDLLASSRESIQQEVRQIENERLKVRYESS